MRPWKSIRDILTRHLAPAACVFLAMGCVGVGTVAIVDIKPGVTRCLSRHDSYVSQDTTLVESDRESYLHTSAMIRELMEAGEK